MVGKRRVEYGMHNVLYYILYWIGSVYFFIVIRYYGHIEELLSPVSDQLNILSYDLLVMGSLVGCVSGLIMWKLDKLFDEMTQTFASTSRLILVKSVVYFAAFLSMIALLNFAYYISSAPLFDFDSWLELFFSHNTMVFMVYSYGVVLTMTVLKNLKRTAGQKRMIDMLIGSIRPKETEKIFMFLDLNSATRLAEQLGNKDYSMFLKDYFDDLNASLSQHVEIYQYVGDEVVLCWDLKDKEENLDCIETYFRLLDCLVSRRKHYLTKYGTIPTFKAGVHLGKAILTEVGLRKRDLAFHGDVVNTASRIRDLCKRYKAQMIVSKELVTNIENTDQYSFYNLGPLDLRGKNQKITLFSVSNH